MEETSKNNETAQLGIGAVQAQPSVALRVRLNAQIYV